MTDDTTLTRLEALGLVVDGTPDMLEIGYAFAVAMIVADGRMVAAELTMTAALGAELFEGFDYDRLAERCRGAESPPSMQALAPMLADVLDDAQKSDLFSFVFAISQADDDVAKAEMDLLDELSKGLGLDFDSRRS